MSYEAQFPIELRTLSQKTGLLPASPSYFRSKLFVAPIGENPYVTAAKPIFSLLDRLNISRTLPPIEDTRQSIEHELKAFQSRIQHPDNSEDSCRLAYFMLCANIDELLGKNYLRVEKETTTFQAFCNHSSTKGSETLFFDILEAIKPQADCYLHLVEFAYYCLMSGFEGQYHNQANGRQQLDQILDDIYQLIQQYNIPREISQDLPASPQIKRPALSHRALSAGLSVIALIGLLSLGHHYLLSKKVEVLTIEPLQTAERYLP